MNTQSTQNKLPNTKQNVNQSTVNFGFLVIKTNLTKKHTTHKYQDTSILHLLSSLQSYKQLKFTAAEYRLLLLLLLEKFI